MNSMGVLLDSTLREGELFKTFPLRVKLRIAELLARIGVRRVELTVDYPPRTRREEIEPIVKLLNDHGVEVVMHGRAYMRDIEAMSSYDVYGVAVYMAVSQIHLDYKLGGIQIGEALERVREAVEAASRNGYRYVRATLEDVTRLYMEGKTEELDRLFEVTKELRDAGATLVSVPDTAGLMTPSIARDFFQYAMSKSSLSLACHFHNDYGYASANTVEALLMGAAEAHVSIYGIGDRNGIADLYEVATAMHDIHGIDLGIKRETLTGAYREFSRLTGIKASWRHPLSEEARTIRAGVHQSMAIKKPEGYIPPLKLKFDFETVKYAATPHLSHKVIAEIARRSGREIDPETARTAAERLAQYYAEHEGQVTIRGITELLSSFLGFSVNESSVRSLFGEERVYVLVKVRPQADTPRIVSEIMSWDDVDTVDEVYGDMDLVVTGRIKIGTDNLVERMRRLYSQDFEHINVLITD
jgi:isopropylmalate/homocitrate/citramalate synthase